MNWLAEYRDLTLPLLKGGAHDNPSAGLCAMEMVAFLERLPHSDRPECTCPVVAAYVRCINDMMADGEREQLKPFLPRLVGTVAPERERARGEYLAWQAIRVFAPVALRARGFEQHARNLEGQTDLRAARKAAYAAAAYAASAAAAAAAYAAADAAAAAAAAAADAAYAAAAARHKVVEAALAALDGVLAIGAVAPRTWPRERVVELTQFA